MQPVQQVIPLDPAVLFSVFQSITMRVGVIIAVEDFPKSRKPAYRVTVDFGAANGQKRSSVQATNYEKTSLLGMQVVCVTNLPAKQIGTFQSDVLILGVPGEDGHLCLLTPSRKATLGGKVY